LSTAYTTSESSTIGYAPLSYTSYALLSYTGGASLSYTGSPICCISTHTSKIGTNSFGP
jgi:hypothetical protein